MLTINRESSEAYYQQVYRQLAEAIEEGLYHPGEQLPSLRKSAQALGVSRNTIEQAYQMLTQEGYVDARAGSGYVVNQRDAKPQRATGFDNAYQTLLYQLHERSTKAIPPLTFDFAYDSMDPTLFPFTHWAHASREVLQGHSAVDICFYGDHRGLPALRQQIAEYLIREEDIRAVPEQILIMPTTRIAMGTLLQLFDPHLTSITVENPGFPDIVNACRAQGFAVIPHSVYPENRWDTFVKHDNNSKLVYCTPANQYPTNAVMALEDRKALVQWAVENDGYLIEDAYCHEFRYKRDRLPSLHALDTKGRVIVMGTFSKSLAPSLCISYLVLPPQLMLEWMGPRSPLHSLVSWQTQATLAEFIREGHWYQHLHKIQTSFRHKYQEVIHSLEATMGPRIDYVEHENGLHILLTTRDNRPADELYRAAAKAGVRLYRTEQDFIGDVPRDWRYLLMGYGGITFDKIRPGIEALARAWGF